VLVAVLQEVMCGENHDLDVASLDTLSGTLSGTILAEDIPGYLRTDAHPFRLEGSRAMIKPAGKIRLAPHAYPRVGPLFGYRCVNQQIYICTPA
jgi:hypothetical protein